MRFGGGAAVPVASHAGLFRAARFLSLPNRERDEKRAPLKTAAWEATVPVECWILCNSARVVATFKKGSLMDDRILTFFKVPLL